MALQLTWIIALVVTVAAFVIKALSIFGILPGFDVLTPILLGIAITIGAYGAGLHEPRWIIALMSISILALVLIEYYNVGGLGAIV